MRGPLGRGAELASQLLLPRPGAERGGACGAGRGLRAPAHSSRAAPRPEHSVLTDPSAASSARQVKRRRVGQGGNRAGNPRVYKEEKKKEKRPLSGSTVVPAATSWPGEEQEAGGGGRGEAGRWQEDPAARAPGPASTRKSTADGPAGPFHPRQPRFLETFMSLNQGFRRSPELGERQAETDAWAGSWRPATGLEAFPTQLELGARSGASRLCRCCCVRTRHHPPPCGREGPRTPEGSTWLSAPGLQCQGGPASHGGGRGEGLGGSASPPLRGVNWLLGLSREGAGPGPWLQNGLVALPWGPGVLAQDSCALESDPIQPAPSQIKASREVRVLCDVRQVL